MLEVIALILVIVVLIARSKWGYNFVFKLLYSLFNTFVGWHVIRLMRVSSKLENSPKALADDSKAHRLTQSVQINETTTVLTVATLSDNYSYVIIDTSDEDEPVCAIVDPADPFFVMSQLEHYAKNANFPTPKLRMILTTHAHWDHSGGNQELKSMFESRYKHLFRGDDDQKGVLVVGATGHKVPGMNFPVEHNQVFSLGALTIKAIHTPCHSRSDVCYLFSTTPDLDDVLSEDQDEEEEEDEVDLFLFCGDTIFVSGIGRFFEGNAAEMLQNLRQHIFKLPKRTVLFTGHEYALKNLRWTVTVDPLNEKVRERLIKAHECNAENKVFPQTTLRQELEHNPFLRVENVELQHLHGCLDPVGLMGKFRGSRSAFK
eukprot:TRINITY_DN29632_c0_g1_i1.p1 TRINITY_DN29632_c0_g1~~TRINITY_DN29632_c0_g1_i1.p1  ORF type:complete len:405 (+),score=78.84 TRINITY_DN29632_c0_g1_i1:95-1216(+)